MIIYHGWLVVHEQAISSIYHSRSQTPVWEQDREAPASRTIPMELELPGLGFQAGAWEPGEHRYLNSYLVSGFISLGLFLMAFCITPDEMVPSMRNFNQWSIVVKIRLVSSGLEKSCS